MHRDDPVTQIEVNLHHDTQNENQVATSQKIHASICRKKSLDGSHGYIYLNEGNNDEKVVFPGNTEQHKPVCLIREGSIEKRSHDHDSLITEGSIEGRSHDATDQDGKNHVKKTGNYYIAKDESKEVAIRENDTNQIENEEYYSSQADIKEVIEKKGRVRERTSRLRIEVFESVEQCNQNYHSDIKPRKEKPSESIEQNRDNAFNKIDIYHNTQGKPHIESEKEINDSDEDDINLAKAIKQQNEKHVRKVRVSNGRSSESIYRDEGDYFSKN